MREECREGCLAEQHCSYGKERRPSPVPGGKASHGPTHASKMMNGVADLDIRSIHMQVQQLLASLSRELGVEGSRVLGVCGVTSR